MRNVLRPFKVVRKLGYELSGRLFSRANQEDYHILDGDTFSTPVHMKEIILIGHVFFGVASILMTVWIFVDVLNIHSSNLQRVRTLSLAAALSFWIAFVLGGYWYVVFYPMDKALILKGPWPAAHTYFMETKEHLVIMLLLLATYLPIVARNNLLDDKGARKLTLWMAGMMSLLTLLMEGHGALTALGVKMALLALQIVH